MNVVIYGLCFDSVYLMYARKLYLWNDFFRGLFLIDPQGILRQITINDLPVGRSVEETVRLVKAFQFVEKHGEGMCYLLY